MYQGLSARHDWPVKNAIVDLPIKIYEIWNALPVICFSPLGAQNKNISAAGRRYKPRLNYIGDAGYKYSETSIKWTLSWVPKLTSYVSLYNEPLFSRHLY